MEPSFFKLQRAFTAYLRDPEHTPRPPELPQERLAVYSNAVLSNAETFLADNYPRIKELLSDEVWQALVRDYFNRHESRTPLFVELPNEFLRYLEELRDEPDDPAFLLELAHFDLLENIVSTDERQINDDGVDRHGDLRFGKPVLNPTSQLVRYAFPVHTIDRDNQPQTVPDSPTFIIAFRSREMRYGYTNLNAATARAVEIMLNSSELSGEAILQQLADELMQENSAAIVEGGIEIFERFRAQDLILGTALS